MSSAQPLGFFDQLILYELRQRGTLLDMELARRLQCPRAALLERLKKLWQRGYLALDPSEGQLSLTEKGLDSCISLKHLFAAAPEGNLTSRAEAFDWTGLYIPEPGWLDS